MPDPSEPLLPLVARGDAAVVEACLQRYTPLVWSLARRLSRDVNAVDDVVQEILVDIWRSAARFDPALGTEATLRPTSRASSTSGRGPSARTSPGGRRV